MTSVVNVIESINPYIKELATKYKLSGTVTFGFASSQFLDETIKYEINNIENIITKDLEDILKYGGGHNTTFQNINLNPIKNTILTAIQTIQTYCSIVFEQDDITSNPYIIISGMAGASPDYGFGIFPYSETQKNSVIGVELLNNIDLYYSSASDGTNYATWFAIHEVLHTLGIKHKNNGGFENSLFQDLNHAKYTVMSYNTNSFPGAGHTLTPMALDVATLHYLYGGKEKAAGNTQYTLLDSGENLVNAAESGLVAIGRAYYNIWDTGGVDEISYSGYHKSIINLNEATLSNQHSKTMLDASALIMNHQALQLLWNNLPTEIKEQFSIPALSAGGYISTTFTDTQVKEGGFTIANSSVTNGAFDTGIENAKGGYNDDIIIGNEMNNDLFGYEGNDFIYGGEGNDRIWGGIGDDILYGGKGDNEIYGGAGEDIIFTDIGWNYVDAGNGDDIVHIKGQGTYYGWGGYDHFDITEFINVGQENDYFGSNGLINGEYNTNFLYTTSINDFSLLILNNKVNLYAKNIKIENIDYFALNRGYNFDYKPYHYNLNDYFSISDIYNYMLLYDHNNYGLHDDLHWTQITKAVNFSSSINKDTPVFKFIMPTAEAGYDYITFDNENNITVNYNNNTYTGRVFINSGTREYSIVLEENFYNNTFDGDTLITGTFNVSKIKYLNNTNYFTDEQSTTHVFQFIMIDDSPYVWEDESINTIMSAVNKNHTEDNSYEVVRGNHQNNIHYIDEYITASPHVDGNSNYISEGEYWLS